MKYFATIIVNLVDDDGYDLFGNNGYVEKLTGIRPLELWSFRPLGRKEKPYIIYRKEFHSLELDGDCYPVIINPKYPQNNDFALEA